MNILVVDDEKLIRDVVREYMEQEKYHVYEAEDGVEALTLFKENQIDAVVLDVMMPNLDGFSAFKDMRKIKKVPTIILSARNEEYDKLYGFELGIDDYLTKPFSPKELVARVKAITLRNSLQDKYVYETLELDNLSHILKIDGSEVKITPKEFEILNYLIRNKDIAISREQLLSNIWGYDYFGDDRTIDTHIKMLRNNLGKYRELIITIHGMGYKYSEKA